MKSKAIFTRYYKCYKVCMYSNLTVWIEAIDTACSFDTFKHAFSHIDYITK